MSQERVFFLLAGALAVGTCLLFRHVHRVDVSVAEIRRSLSWNQADRIASQAPEFSRTIAHRTEACVEFGWTLAKAGYARAAEEFFQAAWDANPMNNRPAEALAGLYFSLKRPDDVRRIFSRTSARGIPLSREGNEMRASQLIIDRNYAQAFDVLSKMSPELPPDASMLKKLGDLQTWQGRYAEATPFYRKALAQKPDDDVQLSLVHALVWDAMADARASVAKKMSEQ